MVLTNTIIVTKTRVVQLPVCSLLSYDSKQKKKNFFSSIPILYHAFFYLFKSKKQVKDKPRRRLVHRNTTNSRILLHFKEKRKRAIDACVQPIRLSKQLLEKKKKNAILISMNTIDASTEQKKN